MSLPSKDGVQGNGLSQATNGLAQGPDAPAQIQRHSTMMSSGSTIGHMSSEFGDRNLLKSNAAVLKQVKEANEKFEMGKLVINDILQFSSPEYFCTEGEGFIEVQVDRLGQAKGTAVCEYFTKDGSAKAGVKYKPQMGTLVFGPNQLEHKIRIPIMEDESFDSVLEFEVHLRNVQNANLDLYLSKTEVTIVDDDVFPTNRFRAQIKAGDICGVTPHHMLIEFFKMNLTVRRIRWAFIKTSISDQVENLKHIWYILITQFLIDEVLRPTDGSKPPDDAYMQVSIIVCLMLIPHPVQWMLNQFSANRRVAGKAIAPLQANLMRKFLNYSEPSRKSVSNADLTMSVTRDVPQLVHEGFCMIFPILSKIGLLFMLGGLAIQRQEGIHRYLNIGFFFAYPICMFAFLGMRERGTVRRRHKLFVTQTDLCSLVSRVTDYFRLICDYFQKQETVEKFIEKVGECNNAQTAFTKWSATNQQFAPFLTDVICGAFVLSAAQSVLDGGGVGGFITGVTIFRGIGQCYQGIYEHLLTMQQAIAPLQNIVYYMNLPVDLTDRMAAHRVLLDELDKAQTASTKLLYAGEPPECSLVQETVMIKSGDITEKAVYAQDLVQLDCQDLSFAYTLSSGLPKPVFQDACFEVSQGQLVAVVGPRGSGKSTLLKLLAGVLVPTQGSGLFFVPPHLKVGHVTQNPDIMEEDSILENLVFGPSDGADEDPERVLAIMRRMGMSREVQVAVRQSLSHIHSTSRLDVERESMGKDKTSTEGTMNSVAWRAQQRQKAENDTRMSHTDRCLIHIARGLIMNPEVLVMHKPLAHFDKVQAHRVLELLREYVDLRGLEKPLHERFLRRPRTVIFSAAAMEGITYADLVLQVDDLSVQEVEMDKFKELETLAHKIFLKMDTDESGIVTRDEFLNCHLEDSEAKLFGVDEKHLQGKTPAQKKEIMSKAFDMLDHTCSGEVNFDELWHFMRHHMHANMPTNGNLKAGKGAAANRTKSNLDDMQKGLSKLELNLSNQKNLMTTNGSSWEIPEISFEGYVNKCPKGERFGDAPPSP